MFVPIFNKPSEYLLWLLVQCRKVHHTAQKVVKIIMYHLKHLIFMYLYTFSFCYTIKQIYIGGTTNFEKHKELLLFLR